MNLSHPSELKAVLQRHGFTFTKSLGQNFLIDPHVLEQIVEASGVDAETNVLEIGAGAGTLTRALADHAKRVVSVEIDQNLLPVLQETMAGFANFKLVHADILEVDLAQLTAEAFDDQPFLVIANLPYYITTPIVMRLLESGLPVRQMTLMVQKEVAARMAAKPGGKEYGALSVAVQYYTVPQIALRAEPHCFLPQPKVASSVISLRVLDTPAVAVKDQTFFFKVVKSAFGQRRKTLVNALAGSPYLKIEKAQVGAILQEMGLPAAVRGEALSIAEFAELANRLGHHSV